MEYTRLEINIHYYRRQSTVTFGEIGSKIHILKVLGISTKIICSMAKKKKEEKNLNDRRSTSTALHSDGRS